MPRCYRQEIGGAAPTPVTADGEMATLAPDGRNRAGPTLYGVFGRRIATLPGYPYSEPLKKLDIVWNETTIARLFEIGPHEFTPGSKMPLQKITDAKQRDALIAFLKQATAPK